MSEFNEKEPEFEEAELDEDTEVVEAENEVVEESKEPEEELDRDQIEADYQKALADRNAALTKNLAIQNKLSDYFKRKKTDDQRKTAATSQEENNDLEQRYFALIKSIEHANLDLADQKAFYSQKVEQFNDRKTNKTSSVNAEWDSLLLRKKEVGRTCVFARSGKAVSSRELEQMDEIERRKNGELCAARLEHIKLKNRKDKREKALRDKEELAEGLHLIDFEQLKIENQTYNEKIEERNEDLLKFNSKINSAVQVLTHLKEKLYFVLNENDALRREQEEIEARSAISRDRLGRAKVTRDKLRRENTSLQSSMGLLDKMDLLHDFEGQITKTEHGAPALEKLKQTYAALRKENQALKRKMAKLRAEVEA